MNIVKGIITGLEFDDDLPSDRILFALEAMRYFEQTDGLEVNMDNFRARDDTTCFACCGGAAKAVKDNRLTLDTFCGLDSFQDINYYNMWYVSWKDISWYEKSLDFARVGMIGMMFHYMDITEGAGKTFNRRVAGYDDDPIEFYEEMTILSNDLKEAGY